MPVRDVPSDLVRRLRHPRGEALGAGWANPSFERAARTAVLLGMAGWQLLLIATVPISRGWSISSAVLCLAHLLLLSLAVATLRRGWNHGFVVVMAYALFVLDWWMAPSPASALFFTAWWMAVLAHTYVIPGRWWRLPPLGALLIIPGVMLALRPDLPISIPLSFAIFVLTIAIGIRVGFSFAVDYTLQVDRETQEHAETTAEVEAQRAAVSRVAEDARRLHDTAINTLGAIANGAADVTDSESIRRRCLDDVATLEDVQNATQGRQRAQSGWRRAVRGDGITVRLTGMSEGEVETALADLDGDVAQAISRATAEAVQNAAKHAGAEEVLIDVALTGPDLVVTVRDEGSGTAEAPRAGGGVERSILQRSADHGIDASFESAPGRGTTVRLSYPLDGTSRAPRRVALQPVNVADVLRQVRSLAAFLISAGFGLVAATVSIATHGLTPTPDWLLWLLVVATCAVTNLSHRAGGLTAGMSTLLMIAGPMAFVVSAATVDFARAEPWLWHSVTAASPLLSLLILSSDRVLRVAAFAVYALTGGVLAAMMWSDSRQAAAIIAIGAIAGLALTLGVVYFTRTLSSLVARAVREHNEHFALQVESAALRVTKEYRQRWQQTGLEEALVLLEGIADGRLSPHDVDVQERCGRQEHFLRQVVMLDPKLTHVGLWLGRALSSAHERDIELTVRTGSTDPGADRAGEFGRALLHVVNSLPSGVELTASVFVSRQTLTMTLVARTPHLARALEGSDLLSVRRVGDQDLAEITIDLFEETKAATSRDPGVDLDDDPLLTRGAGPLPGPADARGEPTRG